MFLEYSKLVKSKEVPRKACVQRRVSAIFAALQRHGDEKENIPLFSWKSLARNYRIIFISL